jgi:hypothetical protein
VSDAALRLGRTTSYVTLRWSVPCGTLSWPCCVLCDNKVPCMHGAGACRPCCVSYGISLPCASTPHDEASHVALLELSHAANKAAMPLKVHCVSVCPSCLIGGQTWTLWGLRGIAAFLAASETRFRLLLSVACCLHVQRPRARLMLKVHYDCVALPAKPPTPALAILLSVARCLHVQPPRARLTLEVFCLQLPLPL